MSRMTLCPTWGPPVDSGRGVPFAIAQSNRAARAMIFAKELPCLAKQ
ncbi:MAG TPA: hypothetical protein VET87_15290 [Rubrivivax sp.]|nr:hypothetical protein [Rubrivivax sp.]